MKYELIKPVNEQYSALEQILTNRGVPRENIYHFLHTTDDDVSSPSAFGRGKMITATSLLAQAVKNNQKVCTIIDADCDGMTSSAILTSYLRRQFPEWALTHFYWLHHSGKQHGLNDLVDEILEKKFSLVFCPDSGTNDLEAHEKLHNAGCEVIVLDHHIIEQESSNAVIINSKDGTYPNDELSGAGVTYQFCRFLDEMMETAIADDYLDLTALGLVGDMMSLQSLETRHLVYKGLQTDCIRNPFILKMWEQNQFKLGDKVTPWGATFYIVPLVNAIIRSGTQEEKELVFESMLDFMANELVVSTKRGHFLGEQETIVEQAVRTCTNVKNRQTREQDKMLKFLQDQIEYKHMLDHKVLLFLLEGNNGGYQQRNILGLIANKIMGIYQRPCCILTYDYETSTYSGSARGCDKAGVRDFKSICESATGVTFTAGHPGAFGLGIKSDCIEQFLLDTDEALANINDEAVYYVDYIYDGNDVKAKQILDIAELENLWGKDLDESIVAVSGLKITSDMVTLMSADKNPTLKITLGNGVSMIKFGSSKEEYETFNTDGYIEADFICSCNKNEWNGNVSAQLFVRDFQIVDSSKYFF